MRKRILVEFLFSLLAVAAVAAGLSIAGADLAIEALYYSTTTGWSQGNGAIWVFLYRYGNIPAFVIGGLGALAFVLSFFSAKFLPDRKAGLFVVVFLILGPGLIVNTLFKDFWGRPRPSEIVQFGGTETYRPFWNPGTPGVGRSFPSGHAAIGFFIMAPYFVLRRSSPGWARRALAAGILYGMLMGLCRMIQGGHFLTDVIWAGCLVYLTGLFLYYLFRLDREELPHHDTGA
ncbi:MAG TPA: phosphatase PAP2 family protein [Syntrophales bacterium]|nr:phosphatase PAP2 family protein [Syntrophales bacterium]